MNLLLFWIFLLVLSRHESISQDTCEIDGSCDQTCEDEASECSEWAAREECETNREFMYQKCRKSCNLCDVDNFDNPDEIDMENAVEEDEFGIVQIIEESKREEVLAEIEKMTEYFRRLREDSNTSDDMHIILDHCKLKHELCAFWKVEGKCEAVRSDII
jgi:ShK domain-like